MTACRPEFEMISLFNSQSTLLQSQSHPHRYTMHLLAFSKLPKGSVWNEVLFQLTTNMQKKITNNKINK